MKKFISAASLILLLGSLALPAFSLNENIAKGCSVSVSPDFDYGNTGNNKASLTDGVYTKGRLWMQKGAVGWETAPIANITIDLGSVQPVSGVSFSTAAGDDSVMWPGSIMIWTSNDSQNWYYAGELVSLSEKNGLPQTKNYTNYRYFTHDLKNQGRYIRFAVITSNAFVFCDELEVYKGSDNLINQPLKGDAVKDTDARIHEMYFSTRIIYRLKHDSSAVRAAITAAKISKFQKKSLYNRLDKIDAQIENVNDQNTDKFEAVLPINDKDAAIFAVYGSLLKAKGLPQISAWKKNNYDFLTLTEVPEKLTKSAKLSVSMMKNEYRSDSVLLTNASEKPLDMSIKVSGISGSPNPKWLTVSQVAWTDTMIGTPVAAAIPPAKYENGIFKIKIPAGITSKIWITVDSSKLAAGNYKGSLKVIAANNKLSVPLNVYVSSIEMKRPRLSFCTWEYSMVPGTYSISEQNYKASLESLKTHFVDSLWARPKDIPWPTLDNFDSKGNIVRPLDFTVFSKWIINRPEARNYLVYLDVPTEFCGEKMGSDKFNVYVGNWMKALANNMTSLGRKPSQLGFMIKDEPDTEAQNIIIEWAKAINAAKTGITLYQDCNIGRPDKSASMTEAFKLVDVLMPHIAITYIDEKAVKPFFDKLKATGHKMWLYRCEGPARLLDPYRYNRLEAWYCFKQNATGMGLWAFADNRQYKKSSWNEYTWAGNPYSPLFFRPTDVTTGIHWEGVREGIEDNEYLSMLKDAATTTSNTKLKLKAEMLLKEAVNAVVGKFDSVTPRWNENLDSSKADIYRLKVLHMLEQMKKAGAVK